jgi:MoaA/NifB/PqqE/SkfB family radical SAM enzyme
MPYPKAIKILELWISQGLKNVRFSGGEPTLYRELPELIQQARTGGVNRIAISTNGSAGISLYLRLIECGVDDFSISLDACCSSVCNKMSGGSNCWDRIIENIRILSSLTYVTVGMVFTEENIEQCMESVRFAASLGVADIRVIPSAQYNKALSTLSELPDSFLVKYPILNYRIQNIRNGCNVRGIPDGNCNHCRLVLDDMAVAGKYHFPCIIYMREGGNPIGEIGDGENLRKSRTEWSYHHPVWKDPICKKNCLDVCIDYNKIANSVFKP